MTVAPQEEKPREEKPREEKQSGADLSARRPRHGADGRVVIERHAAAPRRVPAAAGNPAPAERCVQTFRDPNARRRDNVTGGAGSGTLALRGALAMESDYHRIAV